MTLFLKSKSSEIHKLVERAEKLAATIQKQPLEYILCHADIHGWNLIVDKEGALHIVDWDTLIFAPVERDLMFVGAGIWDSGLTAFVEESLFYQGYGQTKINQDAICYYRFERIQRIKKNHTAGADQNMLCEKAGFLKAEIQPNESVLWMLCLRDKRT